MATMSGARRRMPDFILGGAMKSGTTTVWTWLAQHPDVGPANVKEPRFLTREVSWFDGAGATAPLRSGRFREGLGWYQSLFAECAGRRVIG